MSRGKKAKTKGKNKASAKSTPHKTPSKRHSSQAWPAQESTAPKFSLKDEARWASSHRTAAYESGRKLRDMPIQFISAGHLEGTLKERLPVAEPAQHQHQSQSESESDSIAPSSPSSTDSPTNTRAMAQMAIRSPSPAASEASSSSADEVVFMGRGRTVPPPPAASTAAQTADVPVSQVAGTTRVPPQLTTASTEDYTTGATATKVEATASIELSIHLQAPEPAAEPTAEPEDAHSDADSIADQPFSKRRSGRPAWEGKTTEWEHRSKPGIGWLPDESLFDDVNPRDAAMDDYMQNMDDFGLTEEAIAASGFASGFSRREMDLDGGSHNDWESASGSQDEADEFVAADSWDSDMLRDFADLSTSSDVMDTVVRIHSKRTRKTGVHYLCVYEGSVVDDARWLPVSFLKSKAEKELIRVFEEEANLRELARDDTSDSDEEQDDDDDIDDETLARVLQKQEELGLGSDEVLLYAHDEFFGGFDNARGSSFAGFGRPNKKRQARARGGNRDPTFPSASAMADALDMDPYGAFDIMDTERPSLRPKKKGRRGQMPPELDDSDLNEQMQMTWEADRNKKRLKKAEREELRQQGLLGRKGKGADLKVKYQGGLEMEDVVEEMREFMLGSMQTLSLPPMDAPRRAIIHQAASFLNLTSRSRGDGQNRFTILSKTGRTRICTDDDFDRAIRSKGLLQRLLRGAPQNGGRLPKSATFRHGGKARPQTGYRDGDKVGENAPELGPENKGHALMMKMGWTKGMGLGAVDNKGILQPIAHTVKTNKAGLQ